MPLVTITYAFLAWPPSPPKPGEHELWDRPAKVPMTFAPASALRSSPLPRCRTRASGS